MKRYIFDIGKMDNRTEFVSWLQQNGHIVNWPNRPSKEHYIDGLSIEDDSTKVIWEDLLANFYKEGL